jgi:hypothetical protein
MKTNNKKRRGRPLKGSDKIKGIRLDVRLEEVEKQAFCAAAQLNGLDLSAWIRERLRKAAKADLQEAGQPVPFLPR